MPETGDAGAEQVDRDVDELMDGMRKGFRDMIEGRYETDPEVIRENIERRRQDQ